MLNSSWGLDTYCGLLPPSIWCQAVHLVILRRVSNEFKLLSPSEDLVASRTSVSEGAPSLARTRDISNVFEVGTVILSSCGCVDETLLVGAYESERLMGIRLSGIL